MSYLKEFLIQIQQRDFHKFLILWEEYIGEETVDPEEFGQLLKAIQTSEIKKYFGEIIETALPLWKSITDKKASYEIFSLLIDLVTVSSPQLVEIVHQFLQKEHGNDPKFQEKIRLIGLKNSSDITGAISKYDLLSHLIKGHVVFHAGGWGTGEIVDVSFIREHVLVEFENVSGRKDLSFTNALKTLIALPKNHFLARRFMDPDGLEREGLEDPVSLIKLLLHDVGPKTAGEIKDELCELIIPEKQWGKWWQNARAKIKKDAMIEAPDSLKDPFYLRKAELNPEEKIIPSIQNLTSAKEILVTTYTFIRDLPQLLKKGESKAFLKERLIGLIEEGSLEETELLQTHLILEQFLEHSPSQQIVKEMLNHVDIEKNISNIDIVALKKQVLLSIRKYRDDWSSVFLSLLFQIPQTQLKDYLLKELEKAGYKETVEKKLEDLRTHPTASPETFLWFFQKVIDGESSLAQKHQYFEAFFILLHAIELQPQYRDLAKKMYSMLVADRYLLVRNLLKGSSLEYVKELLLLASKCQTLNDREMKIFQSLAEVVHPVLTPLKQKKEFLEEEVWTTEEGYNKIKERLEYLANVESLKIAKDLEMALGHGDLRENSEFKFAKEKQKQMQQDIKRMSADLAKARLISPEDISLEEVGVGNIIQVKNEQGEFSRFTILGPWDINPEENIISYQSKLAQVMCGKKIGDRFEFKEEPFEITAIYSYLDTID